MEKSYGINRRGFLEKTAGILGYFPMNRILANRFLTAQNKEEDKEKVFNKVEVYSLPVSLERMIRESENIFIGKVEKISRKEIPYEDLKISVKEIHFNLSGVLKGGIKGEKIVINQDAIVASVSSPLKENDEVLWYLGGKNDLGFSTPLGYHSGHFKIYSDPEDKNYKIANNLKNNQGLWEKQLFEGTSFSKEEIIEELNALKIPDKRINLIIERAEKPSDSGPIQLELLIASTRFLVGKLEKLSDYLSEEGELKNYLTLKIEQSGFAGTTSDTININHLGEFNTVYFDGEKKEIQKSGKLEKKVLKEIAEKLANENFLTLPDKFGNNPVKVNTRKIILEFGGLKKTLILKPGEEISLVMPDYLDENKSVYERFIKIYSYIDRKATNALK